MQISLNYSDSDWKKLNLDEKESDWQIAINIFESRMKERYFQPVDILLKHDEKLPFQNRTFGFVILAIDCMIIETLQSFIDGIDTTDKKSQQKFVEFLTTRQNFKRYFTTDALAKRFYIEYRCGILHQSEIQGDGLLWSVGALLQENNRRLIINRSAFHQAVQLEYIEYLNKIHNPSEIELRKHFRRKMNFICNR